MTANGTSNPPAPGDDAGVHAPCERQGHDLTDNICVRCGHVLKPCARRLRLPSGAVGWCILPEHGAGDCHGVARTELPVPFADLGPQRKPGWGR